MSWAACFPSFGPISPSVKHVTGTYWFQWFCKTIEISKDQWHFRPAWAQLFFTFGLESRGFQTCRRNNGFMVFAKLFKLAGTNACLTCIRLVEFEHPASKLAHPWNIIKIKMFWWNYTLHAPNMSKSLTLARTNGIWPLQALLPIPGTLPANMFCAHVLRTFPRCISAMLKRRPCCNARFISIHYGWFAPCVSPQLVCSLRFIVAGGEGPSQSLRSPVLRLVSRSASRPVKQCLWLNAAQWTRARQGATDVQTQASKAGRREAPSKGSFQHHLMLK